MHLCTRHSSIRYSNPLNPQQPRDPHLKMRKLRHTEVKYFAPIMAQLVSGMEPDPNLKPALSTAVQYSLPKAKEFPSQSFYLGCEIEGKVTRDKRAGKSRSMREFKK